MQKKTFLFFPVEIGLAHIVRPLAVAEELQIRGHTVLFALPKRKHLLFKSAKVQLVEIDSYVESDGTIKIKEFTKYHFHKKLIHQEIALIKKYKPDAIVVDFRISALAAGLITKTPMFFLGLGEAMPYGCKLPNPGVPPLLHSFFQPLFRFIYHKTLIHHLDAIKKIVSEYNISVSWDQWFQKITWILSEPSFYFPSKSRSLSRHYVGPLSWNGFHNDIPDWFSSIFPDNKTIYLTFGGTGFDKKKLVELSVLLVQHGYRVIVSHGSIADTADFPTMNNLFVARFLPGKEITKRVDLMICHGGYGTMIEAIHNKKPVLIAPFNPDQIVHGLRMQELGIAKCLFSFTFQDLNAIARLNWAAIENKGKRLDSQIILKELQTMLKNMPAYKKSLEEFNSKYPYQNGAKQAADIIEKTL